MMILSPQKYIMGNNPPLHPLNSHLTDFPQRVVGIIPMRADQKDMRFRYEALSDLPTGIYADETRLRQILINRLGHAVKVTKDYPFGNRSPPSNSPLTRGERQASPRSRGD